MNTARTRLAVLLTVLVMSAGALALEPFTLGNIFKLGTSTQAGLPACTATTLGGLIYVTDDGGTHSCDGTDWVKVTTGSSSSGESYWVDAGAGYIFADEYIKNPDGGMWVVAMDAASIALASVKPGLTLKSTGFSGGQRISPSFCFAGGTALTDTVGCLYGSSTNSGGMTRGLNLVGGGTGTGGTGRIGFSRGTVPGNGTTLYGYWEDTGELKISQTSSYNAIELLTAGARIDLSTAGTNDYLVSDGTGIETPGYLESTRAITAGPGLITPAVQISGGPATSFTSASFSALGTGSIARNTSFDTLWQAGSSGGFRPIVEPATNRQTVSTRTVGQGVSSYAEIAEYVACNAYGGVAAKVQSLFSNNALTTNGAGGVTTGRSYHGFATTDGTQQYWTTACSSASTTPYAFATTAAGTDGLTSYCQRIATYSDLTTVNYWITLSASLPTADSTDIASGAGFRYAAGVGSNWYFCSFTGGVSSCTDTTIAIAASTEYTLCTYITAGVAAAGYINGNFAGAKNMDAMTNAYPLVMVDPTASVVRAIYTGPMTVESR